jgi:hypothetical protein
MSKNIVFPITISKNEIGRRRHFYVELKDTEPRKEYIKYKNYQSGFCRNLPIDGELMAIVLFMYFRKQ